MTQITERPRTEYAAASAGLRVLFLAPYPPSPIRVRPFHLLKSLKRRGHRVTLVAHVGNSDEARDLEKLRPWCERMVAVPRRKSAALKATLRALVNGSSLQAAYGSGHDLAEAARHCLASDSYDVIHVEHLRAAEAAQMLATADAPPVVLDSVDCISLLFERALRRNPSARTRGMALLDLARTRQYEAGYGSRFAHVIVTSNEDRWALETLRANAGLPSGTPVSVVPNGVDTAYWASNDAPRDRDTLIFSGKMSYHANEAAALFLAREIMPLVWSARPQTKLVIAGAGPGRDVLSLASDPRITVTGFVPDLRPYLASATIAVAPIRYGVGVQNKVLEAMAMSAPVVAARQATLALAARPGEALLTADHADEYADRILALLNDRARQDSLGAAGRRYVVDTHDWDASAVTLENIYQAAIAAKVAPQP